MDNLLWIEVEAFIFNFCDSDKSFSYVEIGMDLSLLFTEYSKSSIGRESSKWVKFFNSAIVNFLISPKTNTFTPFL